MADQVLVEFGELESDYLATPPPSPTPEIPAVDNKFTSAHLTGGAYDDYFIDTIYRTDSGLRVLPKAASSANAEISNSIVRIHRGTTTKEVHWKTQRRNAKPKIPKWNTGDPNEIPLTQTMNLTNMAEGGGAGTIWTANGVYTYALVKPKGGESKYPVGSSPAELAPSSQRWYGPDDFSETILDAAFATPPGAPLQTPIRVGT